MNLNHLKERGLQIAGSLVKANFVEVRPDNRQLLLKERLIAFIGGKALSTKEISDVSRIYVTRDGICVEHDIFGTLAIRPERVVFTTSESTIHFGVDLLVDKQRNEMLAKLGNAAVSAIAGALLLAITQGMFGAGLLGSGAMAAAGASFTYGTAPRLNCIGDDQNLAFPSFASLAKSPRAQELLLANHGKLSIGLMTEDKAVVVSADSLSFENLLQIKDTLSTLAMSLRESISHSPDENDTNAQPL